jgi:hypothetical protein
MKVGTLFFEKIRMNVWKRNNNTIDIIDGRYRCRIIPGLVIGPIRIFDVMSANFVFPFSLFLLRLSLLLLTEDLAWIDD